MGLDAFAAEREDRREGWEAYLAGQLGDAVPAALGSITANWSQVLAGLDLVEQVLALAPGELTAPAVAAALPQIQTQVERVLNPGAADGEGWPVFFLALMYDELAAHKAHLTDRGGGLPGGEADRDALGWERQPDGTWRPRGPKLGYCLQDGRTGLLPDVAYERFAARARADRRVPPGKAELLALLDRAGVIEVAHEEGRRQPRRTLRLWHDGPRLIVLQHGDGFLGERGNGGTPADDGPHACLSTPEPAPMAPFPRSPVPPAQAALCAENGAHCSPAEEAAAPAGAAPVSIGAGACSPGAATPDGGSTRCDRDSCGLALAESRDAAWGGWCLGHAARGQLLSLASIAEPEPWPRLPLGAGNAVAAGPDAWQQFARVADDERLALALRRLLGEPDPPASVPPVPAATGERDYRDAWRARGAALIHAGGRCPDCGREERVRLSSGEWACASCTSPPDGDPPPTERPADDAPRPSHPRRLATLGADGLYLMAGEKPQRLDVPPPGDVGALLDLMARMDVRQLWIHASTLAGLGLPAELPRGENGRPRDDVPHPFFAAAGGWDIAGPALRWWYRARRDGLSLQIAIPAYNVLKGNWGGCWDTPATAGALLVALSAFSHALGMLPVGGPGRTGEALLRRLLRTSPTGRELTAITPPPPALAGRREGDLAWMRPLTDAERAAGFVHSFDRNAQYLSVMGSLSVGIGEPEYRTGPDLAFDRKLPGYWHAVITAELPANLPDPFPCDPAGRWYTTPTLELAAQLGARITLREAYVWPEHSRLLERWYRIVREARLTLSGPAREAVKALYTQFIGHLESRIWEREGEAFYRPDIRQLIIAQARVNFWRILRRCADEGRPPVLVYVDEALFVGESADPLSAKPAAIALGPDLASFKHSASTPLADVLPAWEGPRLNPVKVLELLKGSEGVE
jgi:hypothetical protein